MQVKANETAMARALKRVEELVNGIGYEGINPESLMALGDSLERDEECVEFGMNDHGAYRMVMRGFHALLAPVEAA
jgi:hypothetical protein